MDNVIMIGCDLHDATMVLRVCDARGGASIRKTFVASNREGLIAWLRQLAGDLQATRIVFAYEASGQGFGLHDELQDAGIECHVLAPTRLPHTVHSRKSKTDDHDAAMILDEVRSYVLAKRPLPDVWVPDTQTRDDREAVRLRLETAVQRTRIKNQIRNLLKRSQLDFPAWFSGSGEWSKRSLAWLDELALGACGRLKEGAQAALSSLVSVYRTLSLEIRRLDGAIKALSAAPRYARAYRKLTQLGGVGMLSAMVFLTELGDLERFANRRQLAAYLGLAPSSHESGRQSDRKGRITRQGPARVRHVLCQAAWAALRSGHGWREKYDRIKGGSKTRGKIAIVAVMRQLAVLMWQTARSPELDRILDEQGGRRTSAGRKGVRGSPWHGDEALKTL